MKRNTETCTYKMLAPQLRSVRKAMALARIQDILAKGKSEPSRTAATLEAVNSGKLFPIR
jgi:hypothetical protein